MPLRSRDRFRRMATGDASARASAYCAGLQGPRFQGRWAAERADIAALNERHNEADDGSLLAHPTYLLPVAHASDA